MLNLSQTLLWVQWLCCTFLLVQLLHYTCDLSQKNIPYTCRTNQVGVCCFPAFGLFCWFLMKQEFQRYTSKMFLRRVKTDRCQVILFWTLLACTNSILHRHCFLLFIVFEHNLFLIPKLSSVSFFPKTKQTERRVPCFSVYYINNSCESPTQSWRPA